MLGDQNGWPGERWLDIRQLSVLEPIMAARFQICQQKGFDAVEPDNMDSYENSTGFPLQASDQLTYNLWIAAEVHSLGMAVLQKNDPDQASALQLSFDGVLDEQCNQYSSCSAYQAYVSAGKPVLNAEYDASLYPGLCSSDAAKGIMGALFALALDGSVYRPCFWPVTGPPVTGAPTGLGSGTGSARSGGGARWRLDVAAPRVRILGSRGSGRKLTVIAGAVRVTLACPASQSYCAGRLTVRVRRPSKRRRKPGTLLLGARTFRPAGGQRRTLTVRLARHALRRLRAARVVHPTVTVAAHDRAGRRATTHRRLKLRLRPG